jgi:hypothetical protein
MNPANPNETATGAAAKYEVAVQMMCGRDSSALIGRWLAMVEEASDEGHAPAYEMRSVFEAMGVARPQNWERAFDLLLKAAQQGSAAAQRQLLVLARTEPPAPETDDDSFWARTRAAISLAALLAHPERVSLCDSPRIRAIAGFTTPAECAWLRDRARGRLQPATIIDAAGRQTTDPGRSNSGAEFLVQDMDLVIEVVRTRISAATRIPIPVFEPTQVLHYNPGEEFKPHHDFLDPANPAHGGQLANGQRIATFLIYLNEEFEGGQTQFPDVGVEFRGKTGDAIFWANVDMEGRPDRLTRHAGLAPTRGEKWVLSQWIRDRAAAAR